jgi:hypothetical protein
MALLDLLQALPTWLAGTLVCGGMLLLALLGLELVRRLLPDEVRAAHNEIAGFLIAVVGAVYAVLLAFVALDTWNDFTAARHLVGREAALLGDLIRDAAGLRPEVAGLLRQDLLAYGEMVVTTEWPRMAGGESPANGLHLLDRIAATLRTHAAADRGEEVYLATFVDRLNQLYDARRERVLAARQGLEPFVWTVLLLGTGVVLGFSFLFGPRTRAVHRLLCSLLSLSIALVFVLIVAADRPFHGRPRIAPVPFSLLVGRASEERGETAGANRLLDPALGRDPHLPRPAPAPRKDRRGRSWQVRGLSGASLMPASHGWTLNVRVRACGSGQEHEMAHLLRQHLHAAARVPRPDHAA